MGLFARQPAPAVILPIFEQTLAIHFVLLCLTVFAARTNVSGQSAKDFNSTKVAKDTKIGEPRGHRILKMVSSFVLFLYFAVISIFLLVAALPR